MTKDLSMFVLCGVLLCGGVAGFSAEPAPAAFTIDSKLNSDLVRLGGQMMLAGQAYEYDRHLADEIGPRLTGSANYVKAVEWAESEFKRVGLENVHGESWEIPATWEPETPATARIILPHEQRLHLESEGWSPNTPEGGVRGTVYYLDELSVDVVKSRADKIKGNIVLVDGKSFTKHMDEGFGKLFDALNLLSSEGAKALVMGLGGPNNSPNMIGYTNFNGSLANIITANLGQEDTLLMKRLLEKGPVEIEFSFKNRIREHVKVENVIAEIPGREGSAEYVLIGGHLDSWQPGTGAQDNGTGAATVLAVAEAVKASGLKPRRTMRFILFGGEEEGMIGSLRYANAHAGDAARCAGVFISDSGAEAPKGWYVFGRKDEAEALKVLNKPLSSLGASETTDEGEHTFSTDEAPFLVQGVPAFVLWTATEKYGALHHKPSDTFDKVNQRDLNLGAAVVGLTAYAFADAPETMKHYSPDQVQEQLKGIKALAQYKDMQAHKLF
jgi:carboxypeptidase Q